MKTKIKIISIVCVLITGFSQAQSPSPQVPALADSLAMDDSQIITSIAPYPADMRAAILDVAQYPQALVKLERIQARSSQSFQDLIDPLSREDQEKIYQTSRFPETVSKMVIAGRNNPDRVKPLLKDYPPELQQQMLDTYNTHYDELMKMDRIYQSSQGTMETVTGKYPKSSQENFKKILANPDVMSLLTDNINLTVSLGDAYKSDPKGVTDQLDQMNKQLSDQSEKDLSAYKDTVSKDPKLQQEMKDAANDYAQQNNQSYNPTNYVPNNYYDNYPYPYWFGYPYWYGSPMWYPRPFYYQTGFYYGAGGSMVIVGMPSAGYAGWFFRRGYIRYPGLYGYYNNYYNLHPRNIVNRNVYRGFNHTANNFYNYRNRTTNNYNNGRSRTYSAPRNTTAPRDGYSRTSTNSSNSNSRMSQMNLQHNNFNNQGLQRYHATTYHNMGWQHAGGVGGAGRGYSSGGGGRGFSGAGGMGGRRGR